jgi:thiol-disulfide isomerase/thioredoxin
MSKEIKVFIGIIIGFFVIIGGLFYWNEKTPGKYDAFAQCISDSGAKFYGAYWCPHCQAQKLLFGKSVEKLPYVECALQGQEKMDSDNAIQKAVIDGKLQMGTDGNLLPGQDPEKIGIKVRTDICKENNIIGFPTWKFPDGSIVNGEQTFAQLAEKTKCVAPAN